MSNNKSSKIYKQTIISFFLVLLLCIIVSALYVQSKVSTEKLEMENLIIEKSTQISDAITKLLYKTEVLSALIVQGNGDIDDFDLIAKTIIDDPAILNILIAPGGVVSKAYPPAAAQSLTGLNFFDENEWAGNREALLARDTGQLVLAGPFIVTSGDLAITGRKPVYINTPEEENALWGLVSVTLKFPDALNDAKLNELGAYGVEYEIWRTNPDTDEKQIIAESEFASGRKDNYTEKLITIQNANWYFRIYSSQAWYGYLELWLIIIAGLSISLLIAFIVQKNTEINILQQATEDQNKTIMSGISYARKIQRNLLPQDNDMAEVFTDFSVIWKPRDVVGGDVYWLKKFKTGTVLCVADCTGHGTPGALLTTLVTSALEAIVWDGNCDDTADILWQLDKRLSSVLHVGTERDTRRGITDIDDGCDVVVMFIRGDGGVQFASGNIPVFICDGEKVVQHKGQKLFIGENRIKSSSEIEVKSIPADPKNKFYIASDGLFDQIGKRTGDLSERGTQFGYESFKQIVLEKHNEKMDIITAGIWNAYEQHRGDEAQRDDFELVAFKP